MTDTAAQARESTLYYFWAPWCGPCKMSGIALDHFSLKNQDHVAIRKVHVDQQPGLVEAYRVETIPTIIIEREGKVVWRWTGTFMVSQLERAIAQFGSEFSVVVPDAEAAANQ